MFNLKVHKETMPYKLYTESNLKREVIPFNEFKDQYRDEHIDYTTTDELEQACTQLLVNARSVKSYNETTHMIDIMKYAKYYFIKDCITLMDGVRKFDHDLNEVFKNANNKFPSINQCNRLRLRTYILFLQRLPQTIR